MKRQLFLHPPLPAGQPTIHIWKAKIPPLPARNEQYSQTILLGCWWRHSTDVLVLNRQFHSNRLSIPPNLDPSNGTETATLIRSGPKDVIIYLIHMKNGSAAHFLLNKVYKNYVNLQRTLSVSISFFLYGLAGGSMQSCWE